MQYKSAVVIETAVSRKRQFQEKDMKFFHALLTSLYLRIKNTSNLCTFMRLT